jgi:hypothetical protein
MRSEDREALVRRSMDASIVCAFEGERPSRMEYFLDRGTARAAAEANS